MPWARGQSGNPAGRPKARDDISRIARMYGPKAIEALAELAALAPGKPADNDATRIAALRELLDRGYGKATQILGGDAENPVTYVIRGPSPVESTAEWLRLHAPTIDADETNIVADETK